MFGPKQHLLGLVFLYVGMACANQSGPLVVGQTFLANSLDPTDGSAGWALISHGVAEKLFTVDKDDMIVGQVAQNVTRVSEFVWDVTLRSNYKFSDGTVVNAQHVAEALMELNTKNSNAQSSLGNMSVTATNELTVRIQSDRPTTIMSSVLAEWAFVVYYKDANENFVFTGPFAIENFEDGSHIDLVPNSFYPRASERPNVKINKIGEGRDLAEAVMNHSVDIAFHLPIDSLPEVRREDGVLVKSFEVGYQHMIFYNIDRLQDVRVRKAIDLAIDRNELSQVLAGGRATRSLFPDYSPFFFDSSDTNGDLNAAEAMLDGAGWTLDSNGKRSNGDGVHLEITLVAYPQRPDLVTMQPVIAEDLTALGITVTSIVTGEDWDETQQIIDDRSFDMLLWAQHTMPAGDPGWFLNAFFRSDGGNNHANLNSETVDSHLDSLSLAEDQDERVLLTQAAHKAIQDEVPVSSLVTPFWHVGLSDRMKDYEPWGSDYYVIRSDLFSPVTTEVGGGNEQNDENDGTTSGNNGGRSWEGGVVRCALNALLLLVW